MKIQVNFKKTKSSKEIKEYAKEKMQRELEKFPNTAEIANIVISQKGETYSASCHVKGANSYSFYSEAFGHEKHEAVDSMIKKVHAVLRKKKDKATDHREVHPKGHKNEAYADTNFIDFYHDDNELISIDSEDLLKLENLKKKSGS